jgi:branched-chain amino acid transport system substrate-binding protein
MTTQILVSQPAQLYHYLVTRVWLLHRRNFLLSLMAVVYCGVMSVSLLHAREIKVGVVMDQSSINSDLSRDYMAGARAYFDYHNSTAQSGALRFNLIVRDDAGIPANTVTLTRELIEKQGVQALFGYVGDSGIDNLMSDSILKRAGVALYAPLSGNTSDNPDAMQDNIYYVRPSYRDEAKYIINHFQLIGLTRFLVVHDANTTKLSSQISDEIANHKLRPPQQVLLKSDMSNVAAVVSEVRRLQPQVVIMTTDTITTAEFMKVFRRVDKGTSVVGFSTINHRTLRDLAGAEFAAGMLITQVVPHPEMTVSKVQIEHLKMMEKFRDEPPSHLTLEGFIAAKSFALAVTKAGAPSRSSILAALSSQRRIDIGGITLAFTDKRDRGSSFVELAFLRRSGKLIQ